jgi:hypothetical protein
MRCVEGGCDGRGGCGCRQRRGLRDGMDLPRQPADQTLRSRPVAGFHTCPLSTARIWRSEERFSFFEGQSGRGSIPSPLVIWASALMIGWAQAGGGWVPPQGMGPSKESVARSVRPPPPPSPPARAPTHLRAAAPRVLVAFAFASAGSAPHLAAGRPCGPAGGCRPAAGRQIRVQLSRMQAPVVTRTGEALHAQTACTCGGARE